MIRERFTPILSKIKIKSVGYALRSFLSDYKIFIFKNRRVLEKIRLASCDTYFSTLFAENPVNISKTITSKNCRNFCTHTIQVVH